ncbi:hypothetical protein TSARBOMBA_208 [Bacillus phage TsarBomba]|uniref:Uncharacterized protein n=1 Tax=Bacillus phage TsarBomba TaxID=1690456 RepID=A0A0K2CZU1_9CAUD|nr:hypothetical protein TSARBOMBA_208 [Bacillus phage TsarBomba]ALA13079.1 hypothetical protein TSARBOMBA_208 [Bacillus phage TsarBomba]
MKIEALELKVAKGEEKVNKCAGTIEKHKKQLEKKIQKVHKEVGADLTGQSKEEIEKSREPFICTDHSWSFFEVIRKLDDIKGAEKKLGEAEQILANWKEKLSIELNNEKFVQDNAPQVIKDFLEAWKAQAHEWHVRRYQGYQDFKKELAANVLETMLQCIKDTPQYAKYLDENGNVQEYYNSVYELSNVTPRKYMSDYLKEHGLDYKSIENRKANYAGALVIRMDTMRDETERLAWLEQTLEQDKKAKMLDLIYRISGAVGEITDASNLKVSQKGNLDGFIVGTTGKARVETIGAGGWNIVCFHYRTLIKKIK